MIENIFKAYDYENGKLVLYVSSGFHYQGHQNLPSIFSNNVFKIIENGDSYDLNQTISDTRNINVSNGKILKVSADQKSLYLSDLLIFNNNNFTIEQPTLSNDGTHISFMNSKDSYILKKTGSTFQLIDILYNKSCILTNNLILTYSLMSENPKILWVNTIDKNPIISHISPQLFLSTGTINAGNQNTISGSSFSTLNSAKLNFSINGVQSSQTVQTDYQGNFSYTYTPSSSSNNYYVLVSAIDLVTGKTTNTKTFQVKTPVVSYSPTINLQSLQGKYVVNNAIPISWSDKMYLNFAGISYSHDINGIRDYSYTVSYSTNGNNWTNIQTLAGKSISDIVKNFTINFKPLTTSDNYQIRITDNLNALNIALSEKFSVIDNASPLVVSLHWDNSFPKNGVENPKGVAADGVARILIKVRHVNGSAINSATIQLQDKDGKTTPPSSLLGKVMSVSDSLSDEANFATEKQITSTKHFNDYWFWYVAPDNFAENGNSDAYAYSNSRIVQALITADDGSTYPLPIEIVRPPLMMVHGIGSDNSCFKNFNYSYNSTKVFYTDKQTDGYVYTNLFKQRYAINLANNEGSFYLNATMLLSNNSKPDNFKGNISALREQGYACNQVDYVCHSMGGCVMRQAIQNYSSYFTKSNYTKGFIHKAITIDTPHNGSPIADAFTELIPRISSDPLNLINMITFGLYAYNPFIQKSLILNMQDKYKLGYQYIDFDVSDAVKNLQTQGIEGVKFNETFVKNHLIAGDINLSKQDAEYFVSNNKWFKILSVLNVIQSPSKILTINAIDAGYDFMNFYSESKGFPNFFQDGDAVVPLKSQVANITNSTSNISIFPQTTNFSIDYWHNSIVDQPIVGKRVLELLNSNINGDLFANSIPANNTKTSSQVRQLVKETLKSTSIETFDTTKIKIINPIRNSTLYTDSVCKLTYHLKDTTNLSYVSYYFQGNSDIVSSRDTIFTIKSQINQEYLGKQMIIVSAVYDLTDSTETHTDTLTVNVQTLASLQGFEVSPKRLELYKGTKYYPTYTAIYSNNIVNIPINSEEIKIKIGNPSIVTYNTSNYSFVGLDTLATYAEISYNGLKDTIYFNVMDTISFSKDITTEVKEIQNNVTNNFFNIYPNPTKGLFTINIIEPIKPEAKIIVSNLLGETVLQKNTTEQKTTLNMDCQPAGIYFIRVITQDKSQCMVKLIKQ